MDQKLEYLLRVGKKKKSKCYLCDGNHSKKSCSFIDKKSSCYHNKRNTTRVCWKKAKSKLGRVFQTNQVDDESNISKGERKHKIDFLSKSRNPPLIIYVKVNSCKVKMEVDT